MKSISVAEAMQHPTNDHLGLGVATSDARHARASFRGRKCVSHRPSLDSPIVARRLDQRTGQGLVAFIVGAAMRARDRWLVHGGSFRLCAGSVQAETQWFRLFLDFCTSITQSRECTPEIILTPLADYAFDAQCT